MYKKEIKLEDNEIPAIINKETGEIKALEPRPNNFPEGKGKFKEYEKYHITNDRFNKVMLAGNFLSYEEVGIISYMSSIAEINTNSLYPLSNDSSTYQLQEWFNVDRKKIKKILDKFFRLGVFLEITYYSASQERELTYWVLNPNISWKGRLRDDSIFTHFKDTLVTKLLS